LSTKRTAGIKARHRRDFIGIADFAPAISNAAPQALVWTARMA
jgi:hypothetical protein